jgi:hypothetical protein
VMRDKHRHIADQIVFTYQLHTRDPAIAATIAIALRDAYAAGVREALEAAAELCERRRHEAPVAARQQEAAYLAKEFRALIPPAPPAPAAAAASDHPPR